MHLAQTVRLNHLIAQEAYRSALERVGGNKEWLLKGKIGGIRRQFNSTGASDTCVRHTTATVQSTRRPTTTRMSNPSCWTFCPVRRSLSPPKYRSMWLLRSVGTPTSPCQRLSTSPLSMKSPFAHTAKVLTKRWLRPIMATRRGYSSVVERLLPKQHVRGSSPLTRSGFPPLL